MVPCYPSRGIVSVSTRSKMKRIWQGLMGPRFATSRVPFAEKRPLSWCIKGLVDDLRCRYGWPAHHAEIFITMDSSAYPPWLCVNWEILAWCFTLVSSVLETPIELLTPRSLWPTDTGRREVGDNGAVWALDAGYKPQDEEKYSYPVWSPSNPCPRRPWSTRP